MYCCTPAAVRYISAYYQLRQKTTSQRKQVNEDYSDCGCPLFGSGKSDPRPQPDLIW